MDSEYNKMYADNPQLLGREQLSVYIPVNDMLNIMKNDDESAFKQFLMFYKSYESVDAMESDPDRDKIPLDRLVIISNTDQRGDVYRKTSDGFVKLFNILPQPISASVDEDGILTLTFNGGISITVNGNVKGPKGDMYLLTEDDKNELKAYVKTAIMEGQW